MKTKSLNIAFNGVSWNDWNEIVDLIDETEWVARSCIEGLPEGIELDWRVTPKDPYTVSLQVSYRTRHTNTSVTDFEVTLYCRDLENGTRVSLNGEVVSHLKYKGLISVALKEILIEAGAVAL